MTPRRLGDGLLLRTAAEGDLDQICALLAARGDEADAEDLLLVAADADEGLAAVMVVVDGDHHGDQGDLVVSTATLLRETVTIGDVDVPTGQVEMVATDPAYEGRGLVRALMDEAHRRSTERGDLLQVMIGIPFFYRQFGYSYAMPIPLPWDVHTVPGPDPEVLVRAAGSADIAAMTALQTALQTGPEAGIDVRMAHSAGCWRWLVQRSGSAQLVAECDGTIIATARQTPPDEGVVLGELAGTDRGLRALVSAAARHGDTAVLERTGLDALLAEIAEPPEAPDRSREWFYARVGSLAPLLDHLRPVLLERFRAAGLGGHHEVLLSSWRSHVRFSIDEDSMSEVVAGGPEQAPISKGGSGVPPDALAPLLLGPYGAAGLETRHGDVLLGRQRDLMEALFPPMTSDLLTFYLAL
jgi:ribosomal protein S18 acetylase RimI-like enzyme